MTLNHAKLGRAVLNFLIWNKITFLASNSLNFAELVEKKLVKSILKKIIKIHFSF